MDLEGKVVLVTGSSRGLGRALIKEYAKNKANVVVNYNNSKKSAIELNNEIKEYNGDSLVIKADISNEKEVENMVKQIIDKFGHIDILINNAGISLDNEPFSKSIDEFKEVINTNLVGTFIVTKCVSKYMLENKCGKIINITSTNAIDTYYPESIDYDAAKAGVISLTNNFSVYLSPYINVFAIALGWMDTDMNKYLDPKFKKKEEERILLKKFGDIKDIATAIVMLSQTNYINNTVIRIDGGYNAR